VAIYCRRAPERHPARVTPQSSPRLAVCSTHTEPGRYYGFTPGIDRYLSNVPEGAAFKKKIMDALAQGPRIVYHGMVGAKDLARAVAAAGFYVYPCTIAEISSISLMRAQAMGAIPITSRHIKSALPETAGKYDLGPPARNGLISDDEDWQAEFIQAVVRAVRAPRVEMDKHRCVNWMELLGLRPTFSLRAFYLQLHDS
jgi:hypothetical protein